MMTARKRWWRAAAIAAVGGVAVTGGWFGLVRATGQPDKPDALPPEATNWARSTAPATPAPVVSEVARTPEPTLATGHVIPAGATLPPLPLPGGNGMPVVPAIPVTPPIAVPAAPLPVPPIDPVAGPRLPDIALTGGERSALPAVPPVPSLPPAELPPLPVPPKAPEVKPVAAPMDLLPKSPAAPVGIAPMPPAPPVGGAPLPALPMSTAEPPKAAPSRVDMGPILPLPPAPGGALLPQPAPLAPSLPSANPADPVQPMLPAKPDSDLKPNNPANTLNPTVAPAVPVSPGGTGRDVPVIPVDRPKPPATAFDPSDKFVFPLNPVVPDPRVPHLRDDTMMNLTTTAMFAVLGGAMLAAEKASALPAVPPKALVPMATVPLKADEKLDAEKVKKDLEAANKKIEDLEKQVKRLTELLTGKRDELGLVVPSDPGAVEEIKRLKNRIGELDTELRALKTQTALKPALLPEAKPRGIVKVVNEYPVEISMVINDKSYRIAPSQKIEVEVPAGDFTYQLLQSGAAATKSVLKDKETVTLRIK